MATGVDAKLLKSTKFPPEFNRKVDIQKVNVQVLQKWIASRISEVLGNEDDVVIELCYNLLEGSRFPDIKALQIQLTGFLAKDTPTFCKELWNLCLSAQDSPQGVPKESKPIRLKNKHDADAKISNAASVSNEIDSEVGVIRTEDVGLATVAAVEAGSLEEAEIDRALLLLGGAGMAVVVLSCA
ncbi:PWI domain-containing protein [Ceratocystis platani]|uniref:PWI domain-containing protein n=1 Tax=Ceratocystis fimbriata f. sp. platani TaxID=88771 RepID=A0A0F8DNN8_CERFI|nr:PWI domain-containing protein [Ceratocystis platani]